MSEQPPPGYGYEQQYNPPTAARPGELLDRFVARLLDSLLLIAANVVIVGLIVTGLIFGTSASAFSSAGGSIAANLVGTVLGVAINLGYFVYMETSRGQTLGKMVMKLRVIGPNGQDPTPEQSVKRNIYLAFALAGIIPFLGIIAGLAALAAVIMIAVGINQDTENRQGWHDRFAGGTRVLKIG